MRDRWFFLIGLPACSAFDVPAPQVCPGPAALAAPAFVDASTSWGTDTLAPRGVRLSAVDLDGDGWTDLVVRDGMNADTADTPTRWVLRNTGAGHFEDITESTGLRTHAPAGGTWVFGDVDGDGDLDLYVGADSTVDGRSQVLLNDGQAGFTPTGTDPWPEEDRPYGAAFTDVDLDGHLDLFVAQYGSAQDRLYRGDGTGQFVDATEAAGLLTEAWTDLDTLNRARAHSNAWAALAVDLTNDGYPELLASSYGRAPNHLWHNQGDGSFANRSLASGYAFDDRTDWSDNESARCWCTLHPSAADCEGVPEPTAIACTEDADAFRWDHDLDRNAFRLGGNSGATLAADLDQDGFVDLMTSEIVHWDVGSSSDPSELLFSEGTSPPTFVRPGREATGFTRTHTLDDWNEGDITGSLFDADNDGLVDLYVGSSDYPGTRALFYRNEGDRTVTAVPTDVGIDHRRAHGSAVADFDGDGDLDLVVGHSTARCEGECYDSPHVRFLENQLAPSNFLQLQLVGTAGTNAAAVGARVSLTPLDGTPQRHDVDGGHGQFGQQDDLVVHAGLGSACEAEVTVHWPDAARSTDTFRLRAGHRYRLVQGGEASLADPD